MSNKTVSMSIEDYEELQARIKAQEEEIESLKGSIAENKGVVIKVENENGHSYEHNNYTASTKSEIAEFVADRMNDCIADALLMKDKVKSQAEEITYFRDKVDTLESIKYHSKLLLRSLLKIQDKEA